MTHHEQVIRTFTLLGERFRTPDAVAGPFASEIYSCHLHNPWFTPEFVRLSLDSWAKALEEEKISSWMNRYGFPETGPSHPRTVAVIMAGNIPMVGLHDLLCVIASGHNAMIKLSSQDDRLIPRVLNLLFEISPLIKARVQVAEHLMKGFDAVIATGSNNTSRYFEYYFGKYPNIIRKNRNSVAVITGKETPEELEGLSDDIFAYFGLGCRNVSKIYIPETYDPESLFAHFGSYRYFSDHNKYRNNYDYQKSIFIINGIPHYDNGFLLLREDRSIISPVSVLHFERYAGIEDIFPLLEVNKDSIQCVITHEDSLPGAILPGQSQFPGLSDYADGIDVMAFLNRLP